MQKLELIKGIWLCLAGSLQKRIQSLSFYNLIIYLQINEASYICSAVIQKK